MFTFSNLSQQQQQDKCKNTCEHFFSLFLAESGAVVNMTVVPINDSTSLISWCPPLFPNGNITSYYIKIISLKSETSMTESNISDTFYINLNLSEYSIIVINFCM